MIRMNIRSFYNGVNICLLVQMGNLNKILLYIYLLTVITYYYDNVALIF